MVLCFRVCMNGLVFQSVLELFFVLFFKVSLVAAIMPVLNCLVFQCAWMVLCFRVCMDGLVFQRCMNGLVFERAHEWSCVSECT